VASCWLELMLTTSSQAVFFFNNLSGETANTTVLIATDGFE
jgi:hypothetical protein|tara:strand:+ start:230 stop:352 length:123 start_codon:yes stop_codon:yes gene_type:complete